MLWAFEFQHRQLPSPEFFKKVAISPSKEQIRNAVCPALRLTSRAQSWLLPA